MTHHSSSRTMLLQLQLDLHHPAKRKRNRIRKAMPKSGWCGPANLKNPRSMNPERKKILFDALGAHIPFFQAGLQCCFPTRNLRRVSLWTNLFNVRFYSMLGERTPRGPKKIRSRKNLREYKVCNEGSMRRTTRPRSTKRKVARWFKSNSWEESKRDRPICWRLYHTSIRSSRRASP